MAVLGTGVYRFPNDPNFAYRAGWISLLTARWPEAYEFLRTGERIGFPEEKLEKATALLAIAAAEVGNTEAADQYFQQLIAIDPEWAQPNPPKAEGWPNELITTLNQIAEPPKAIPVEPEGPED
jgi:tetratricopeptide (TPR) repeat protein